MEKVRFQYGCEMVEVEIPEDSIIAYPHIQKIDPCTDPEETFLQSLNQPVGKRSLAELAEDAGEAVVVICDQTRPMPVSQLLPAVLNELNAGGIADRNIEAVIALGTHRPMTEREITRMVGKGIRERIAVKNHAWADTKSLVSLGETAGGIPVDVNRDVYEAELVVGLSSVKPHRLAGWSGGAKLILPGVCGKKTIDGLHYRGIDFAAREITGTADNPIRREMEEVAEKVGFDFSINLVLNETEKLLFVASGSFTGAHRRAVDFAEAMYRDPQHEEADFLLCGAGEWGPDLWCSIQAMFPAESLVREGGTVAFFSPCPDGIAPHHPQVERFGYMALSEIKKKVEAGLLTDLAAAGHIGVVSRILIEKDIELLIVTEGIPRETVESMGMRWVETPQDAVDYIFQKHSKVARGYCFPVKSITETVVIPW